MRLADLIEGAGTTAQAAAASLGVSPLLLSRIDAGLQPMPASLARRLAALLGAELWEVRAACPLNTDLDDRTLLVALPPRLGEPISAARVAATVAASPSGEPAPPAGNRQLLVFFEDNNTTDGSHILEEWLIDSDGGMVLSTFKANTEDIVGATSGLFRPPSSPDGLFVTDPHQSAVAMLDTATFASLHTASASGTLRSSQQLAWDAGNDFLWFIAPTPRNVLRLAPPATVAATVNLGAGHTPYAICFGQDGLLYALVRNTPATNTQWLVCQVDPSPGSEALLATSLAWTSMGSVMIAASICAPASDPGALYTPGDPNTILRWSVSLDDEINPQFILLSGVPVSGGAVRSLVYDPDLDVFWGLTGTDLFRCNLAGAVDFVEAVDPADADFSIPLVDAGLDVVVVAGTESGPNVVKVFRRSTPGLLTSTPVGGGPNPIGQNLVPLSFALRPA
jgi:hypothetical protein